MNGVTVIKYKSQCIDQYNENMITNYLLNKKSMDEVHFKEICEC